MKCLGAAAVCAAMVGAVGAAQDVRQGPPDLRGPSALHQKDRPLERLITPGQSALVVEKDQSPPLIVLPADGSPPLEWLAKQYPLVVIIRVNNTEARLTPSHDWVQSTVHASVEETLKSTVRTISATEPFRFTQDGGRVVLRGTRVSAVLPYADLFEAGKRYLVFADPTTSDDVYRVEPLVSFRVTEGEALLSPLAHEGFALRERNVLLAVARDRIHAAIQKSR